jgi:hypothetical protein
MFGTGGCHALAIRVNVRTCSEMPSHSDMQEELTINCMAKDLRTAYHTSKQQEISYVKFSRSELRFPTGGPETLIIRNSLLRSGRFTYERNR